VNFFYFLAEDLRKIMAEMGFRTINEMVGRCDKLMVDENLKASKASFLDLSALLTPAFTLREGAATYNITKQDHNLEARLDNILYVKSLPALDHGEKIVIDSPITNTDRAVGVIFSLRAFSPSPS